MSNIPINSGTGPRVAVDLVGTDNYQIVKIMQAGSGTTGSLASVLVVSGTMQVSNLVTITGTVGSLMLQRLDNTNDSVIIYGAQTGTASGVNVAMAVSTSGGLFIASGGGGGAQYSVSGTNMGATATGNVFLGMQTGSTAAQAIALSTTGGIFIASGGGGGAQYAAGSTSMGATGTGTLVIGMQSGSTAGQTLAVTTTGAQYVLFTATQAVTAANVTIASVTTGTMNVVNTVAISGSASVINTVAISGSVTPIGTGNFVLVTTASGLAGGMVRTGHASYFTGYVVATTSAAGGVIVKTSGASTLYITDVLVAVPTPMNVQFCSETTVLAMAYLAANGGWDHSFVEPLRCNSNQSLRVILSSSGTCSVMAIGFTVT